MTAQRSFRDLHVPGDPLLLPNPWDRGSAALLADMGFHAVATTSAGFAYSLARPDAARAVGRDEAIAHAVDLGDASGRPVNADLERGYADDPDGVAETMLAAANAGIAGASIEDATSNPDDPIYPLAAAVERVEAAVDAARRGPGDLVITARAEGLLWGGTDMEEVIQRLQAFVAVGADVVYAPGLPDIAAVAAVTSAVDVPVNVLPKPTMTVAELADAGVARISIGSSMARLAYAALVNSADELLNTGTFAWSADALSFGRLQRTFS